MKHDAALSSAVALTLLFAGCGGGGGSGAPCLGGVYSGLVVKTADTCRALLSPTASVSLTVNQDGSRIVVNQGLLTYEGQVVSDSSFSGVYQDTSGGCDRKVQNTISEISANSGTLHETLSVTCGIVTCQVTYVGTLDRTGSPRPAAVLRSDELPVTLEALTHVAKGS